MKPSTDFLVEILKAINRGEIHFYMKEDLLYAESKEGNKAILNDHLALMRYGNTESFPYELNL